MKKIKLFIYSLFFILLSLYINFNNVYADSNGHVGTAGLPGTCTGRLCYSNEVGVRITIVNKYGDRCYYDQEANKITCGMWIQATDTRSEDLRSTDNYNTPFSLSVDYWFTDNNIVLYPSNCWQYKAKHTKKEFVQYGGLTNLSGVDLCSMSNTWGDATDYKIKWLFFGEASEGAHPKSHTDIKTKTGGWRYINNNSQSVLRTGRETSGQIKIETYRNPENIFNIIDYLECISLTSSSKKFGTDTPLTEYECSTIRTVANKQNNIDIFNRIFQNGFKNRNFDVRNTVLKDTNTKGDIYIQFDEIVAFTSYGGPNGEAYTFKGTVAEVAYLYSYFDHPVGGTNPGSKRWSLLGTGGLISYAKDASTNRPYETDVEIKDINPYATSAICTNIFDGWANQTMEGVIDQGHTETHVIRPENLQIPRRNSYDASIRTAYCYKDSDGKYKLNPNVGKDWLWIRYGWPDTRNVAAFWMKPSTFGSCNEDARSVISAASYKNDTTTNWKKTLFDASDNIKNKCFTDTSSYNPDNFRDSECYQLNPEYIRHLGIAPNKDISGNVIDVCAPISCQNILTYSNVVNTAAYIRDHVSSTPYIENITGESSLETTYDKSIYYLFHTTNSGWDFSDFSNLNYYNYRGMFNKPAECEETPPGPVTVESSCDSSSTVVFEDSSNYNLGVAYTDISGANGVTSYDSNFDIKQEVKKPKYNNDGSIMVNESTGETIYEWVEEIKSGYCKETVTFKFPQSVKLTTAGNVMKWGINESKDSDLFGTMRIERECTYPQKSSGARNAEIIDNNVRLSKISSLNPDIKINYEEAIPSGESRDALNNAGLLYKLSGTNAVPLKSKQTLLEVDSTSKPIGTYSYTCSGCSPGSTVTMAAEYDLVYPDKLKWYYDKSDSITTQLKTKDSIGDEADSNSKYVFMGYGLPTSFYTPTNIYSKDTMLDEYDNKYSYGYVIEDGYYNYKGALLIELNNIGSKVSYNNYHFDKLLGYDSIDNKYSCGFSIKNYLYDTESGNKDCVEDESCIKPTGIDVVFRTVELVDNEADLDKAFPGRAGTGRVDNRGANWKILSNEKVVKLLSTTVYDHSPMYHIELTPSKIRSIRENNKKYRDNRDYNPKGLDPYTYMGKLKTSGSYEYDTYSFQSYDEDATVTYDLSLIDLHDNYVYTTSQYLTDLMDAEYGLDGSCMISNRLERHANTQGCYPWSMIYALNHDDD